MCFKQSGLFLFYFLCLTFCSGQIAAPLLNIQVLTPRGLRVFCPDFANLTSFLFEATIYNVSTTSFSDEIIDGHVWGFGIKQITGGWLFGDPDVEIKEKQRIRYTFFLSTARGGIGEKDEDGLSNLTMSGYYFTRRLFIVNSLVDPKARAPGTNCPESITKVPGQRVCAGETIFEDNFDSFREDNWQIAHYIPIDHPEHPFVSYQRLQTNPTVKVENGSLRISPKLQQDLFMSTNQSILSGTLDLTSGCTELRICSMSSIGVDIVPPIVSGRVTSARFAFTYGTVTVRAKLPQGDWLYPEILLEPLAKKYGNRNYASGVLKVALVRGNMDINNERYSNKWLVGGPILNSRCRGALAYHHMKSKDDEFWGDDFHEYTLEWTPERISLSVDGEEWARYQPGTTGLRSWLPRSCRGDWYELLNAGGVMAPFDDHFYLTLGVAVGGTLEFPDDLTTGDQKPKPWRNRGRKAGFSFWQDKDNWLPTWTQPDLLIDYIKVVAL